MARLDRYQKIRSIHSTLPWSDLDIILEASERARKEFPTGAFAYLDRLQDRGASIATFEIYSPYWFLPDDVPQGIKRELSIASVVSAAAIIAIDDLVDQYDHTPEVSSELSKQANYWGTVAESMLGVRTNWRRALEDWCRPRHGISVDAPPSKIPLRKNPFYRQVASIYTKNSPVPGDRIAIVYTKSLGIIDDILDLVDDFLGNRPNVLLSVLKLSGTACVDELLYKVTRGDMLSRYCRLSIKQMQRARSMASGSRCGLIARTCGVYERKFIDFLPQVTGNFVATCARLRN